MPLWDATIVEKGTCLHHSGISLVPGTLPLSSCILRPHICVNIAPFADVTHRRQNEFCCQKCLSISGRARWQVLVARSC